MATQHILPSVVPQQKPAVIPINSPAQVIPIAESLAGDKARSAIRAANNRTRGVRTFYVPSESDRSLEYVAQFIRRGHQRRWFCNCPDFTFRRLRGRRHCKHLRTLTALVREAHGISRLTISA
jgi:predicted nucleic acid-binding Zn finger protein